MSVTAVKTTPQILVEQSIILHNVSWQTYEQLMKDHENQSVPRFTYQNGELEIFMPSKKHEKFTRFLEIFVFMITDELGLDIESLGSTTFKVKNMKKGVEPDCCFYIQNAEKIRSLEKIDLEKHPAPDLVVEVDITSPSINRFPIYAKFGVKEIWQYQKDKMRIFYLGQNKYSEIEESLVLPKVTNEVLTKFCAESESEKRAVWANNIRNWISETY